MKADYALVAVPLPLDTLFTYRIPTRLKPLALEGARALVEFGGRRLAGFIVELSLADACVELLHELERAASTGGDDGLAQAVFWSVQRDVFVARLGEARRRLADDGGH